MGFQIWLQSTSSFDTPFSSGSSQVNSKFNLHSNRCIQHTAVDGAVDSVHIILPTMQQHSAPRLELICKANRPMKLMQMRREHGLMRAECAWCVSVGANIGASTEIGEKQHLRDCVHRVQIENVVPSSVRQCAVNVQSICNQHAINMQSICNQHAINMQSMCSQCAINMQSMCSQYAVNMQSTCSQYAINVESICNQCAVNVQSMCNQCAVNMQSMCSQYAVNMQSTCNQHAINVQSICNQCAVNVQSICNQCAVNVQSICNQHAACGMTCFDAQ